MVTERFGVRRSSRLAIGDRFAIRAGFGGSFASDVVAFEAFLAQSVHAHADFFLPAEVFRLLPLRT